MNRGTIVQCIGAVVDVEFPRDQIPEIYDALKLDEIGLTLEVQQQLGDGVVRTIALGSSDGLRRGMQVVNTKRADHGAGRRRRRSAASWTCWAVRSTSAGRSTPRSRCRSTARRRRTKSCRRPPSCSRPASRSST